MILQLMSHFFPSTADATMRLLTSISESFETMISRKQWILSRGLAVF